MRPFDWNVLSISLYIYEFYIYPKLTKWGIISAFHHFVLKLDNLILMYCPNFLLSTFSTYAIVMAVKFLLLIALLVFIRGGVPRYRYDFLTKIGWIKFLSLVLAVFLSSLLFTLIF